MRERGTIRFQMEAPPRRETFPVMGFLIGGAVSLGLWLFDGGVSLTAVIAGGLVTVALIAFIMVLIESVYRLSNYVIFHATRVDVLRRPWTYRGSPELKARISYRDISSLQVHADGEIEVDFPRNEAVSPWPWAGAIGAEIHGSVATIRFRPTDSRAVVRELERRVALAREQEVPAP